MEEIYLRLLMLPLVFNLCGVASTPTADLLKFQFAPRATHRQDRCRFTCDNSGRRPVCGTDGRTYPSHCELRRAKSCRHLQVEVANKGRCKGTVSKCFQERAKAQEFSRAQPGTLPFVPRCKADGSYQEVQCHEETRYCWCVSVYGRPIPDTAKPITQKLNCEGIPANGCSSSERSTFNRNLIRLFTDEYNRIPSTTSATGSATKKSSDSSDSEVLRWKFRQLDTDGDQKLKKKEVRNLRRMLKKLVRPKSCAKSFTTYCDADDDRRVTLQEWEDCLSVDTIRPREDTWEKKTGLKASQPGDFRRRPATEKREEKKDCASERLAAQRMNQTDPNSKIFIPVCTAQGQYRPAQCHTGYCWCVDQVTGKPLPGTATRSIMRPECNNTRLRPMKNCKYDHKKVFLQQLLDMYTTEITEYASNNSDARSLQELNPKHSIEERAVRWKFKMLDTNTNNLIDKREKRYLKKDLRNIKPKRKRKAIRRCSREFVSFCDQNSDKAITMSEWLDCTGVKEEQRENLPTNPNRKGPNPFKKWLRSTGS